MSGKLLSTHVLFIVIQFFPSEHLNEGGYLKLLSISLFAVIISSCSSNGQTGSAKKSNQKDLKIDLTQPKGEAVAALAEGCVWCSEHIFEAVIGVNDVISGYAGGTTLNPHVHVQVKMNGVLVDPEFYIDAEFDGAGTTIFLPCN